MSHLSAERLAALADAGALPTATEREHLAACPACVAERRAYLALLDGARAERTALGAPLTQWGGIASALRAEGLLPAFPATHAPRKPQPHPDRHVVTPRPWAQRALRTAAGFVLLVGGLAAGRLSAVVGPLATTAAVQEPVATPPQALAALPEFRSVPDAEAALARFEEGYLRTIAFLAENDSTAWLDEPEGYRTRLLALERAGRTMQEAMEQAPYDPVLTGYYLTTLGQREATLRQLNVVLPVNARLNTF